MKPKGIEITLNILFWIISGWVIASGFSIQSQEIEVINGVETIETIRNDTLILKILICIGVSLMMFYFNLWNITRLHYSTRKTKILIISLLALTITLFVYHGFDVLQLTKMHLPLPMALSTGIILFYFMISTTYGLGKVWFIADKRQQKLLFDKKQAELNLMRNQLHPHFLFNALNNLLSMVDQKRSPKLANSIEKLSQLLRYVIDDAKENYVTIAEEIAFIKNYVALQSLRFETDEIDFDLKINGKFDQQPIEPGLLIPFVENAFKYGTEPERKSEIEATFDLTRENEIDFAIKNTDFKTTEVKSPGLGIESTKERLNMIYPDKHRLHITHDDFFKIELKIVTS